MLIFFQNILSFVFCWEHLDCYFRFEFLHHIILQQIINCYRQILEIVVQSSLICTQLILFHLLKFTILSGFQIYNYF